MRTIFIFVLITLASTCYAKCEVETKEPFADFFARFVASKGFATDRTIYPSQTIRHEYGLDSKGKEVDNPVKTVVTQKMDAQYPPLGEFMKSNSMESRQKSLSSRGAVVEIFKPNSDWLLSYHFQLMGKCWYLHHVEDHSL